MPVRREYADKITYVSIRTRSGERVMHKYSNCYVGVVTVSIRTRSGERVMQEPPGEPAAPVAVSIRTRSGERVMRYRNNNPGNIRKFQSAPALVSG